MEGVYVIGFDVAKHSFQLRGASLDGRVAFRKKLGRAGLLGFLANHGAAWRRWRRSRWRATGAAGSATRCGSRRLST